MAGGLCSINAGRFHFAEGSLGQCCIRHVLQIHFWLNVRAFPPGRDTLPRETGQDFWDLGGKVALQIHTLPCKTQTFPYKHPGSPTLCWEVSVVSYLGRKLVPGRARNWVITVCDGGWFCTSSVATVSDQSVHPSMGGVDTRDSEQLASPVLMLLKVTKG